MRPDVHDISSWQSSQGLMQLCEHWNGEDTILARKTEDASLQHTYQLPVMRWAMVPMDYMACSSISSTELAPQTTLLGLRCAQDPSMLQSSSGAAFTIFSCNFDSMLGRRKEPWHRPQQQERGQRAVSRGGKMTLAAERAEVQAAAQWLHE